MPYRFVRCQTHPKCPDVIGWYLVVEPNDIDTIMKLHKGVTSLYFNKFVLDPHMPKSEMASHYNPITLGAKWLQAVEHHLWDGPICVNASGGYVPLKGMIILGEHISETLEWPEYYEDEIITISRWMKGDHYYLSSNKNRIFVPEKYDSHEKARQVAERYTNRIHSKNHCGC